MIVWVYDRWGNQIDCIGDFVELVHDDELGSLDYIEFTIPGERLSKGNYLVWRDQFQAWHEHRIESVKLQHSGGAVYQTVYADNSLSETLGDYINEKDAYDCAVDYALTKLFEDTRWELGKITAKGTGYHKYYHTTVYDGLVDTVQEWPGEVSTTVYVNSSGVYRRVINYESERGQDNGLLFTYGYDADNIVRTVDIDEVWTRLHCFGKGEEQLDDDGSGTGVYSRRITFADINDGKDYVEDDAALAVWGMPDGKGGIKHSEGQFIWEDCTDKAELLALGREKLKEVSKPRVSYTANVVILADAGMDFKNARTGDKVYIRDEPMDDRINGRVTHVRRYLNDTQPTAITLGNIVRTISNVIKNQQSDIDSINKRSGAWDAAYAADGNWLDKMINNMNDTMNAVGGYVYWRQGEGITVYDRREDDNPTMAIQLKGAGFRIANSKTSTGEWNWRTFGTGDGFTADLLNVGTIRGGSNYWNLETGQLSFSAGSITDAKGNSWNMTTGVLNITNGSINATTINAGTISDKSGANSWNLDAGILSMTKGKIQDARGNYWDMSSGTLNFSSGTINANTITAGSLTVRNSAGQTIMSANLDSKTASVAGMTATGNELQGSSIRVNVDHFDVYSGGSLVGTMGLTAINGGSSVGIWGQGGSGGLSLGSGGSNAMFFPNSKGSIGCYRDLNMNGNTISNANIPTTESIYIGDAIDDEMKFIAITKVNDDGTIAEYVEGCSLEFTNGILTGMVKPKED